MPRIMHFEIHATQPQVLIDFYSQLFGWTFSQFSGMEYWLIYTGPEQQPGINGGLLKRPCAKSGDPASMNAFVCTAQVDSLDDTLSRATALGARIALPKMAVPGVGWLAYILDPDDNTLGMMQFDEKAK
ncbi:MAG: VOC family protein [bacterium]